MAFETPGDFKLEQHHPHHGPANVTGASNGAAPAAVKVSRKQAAASALASVRVEGLDPHLAQPLLDRWASNAITDAQLDEGIRRIAARESLTDLLGPVHA